MIPNDHPNWLGLRIISNVSYYVLQIAPVSPNGLEATLILKTVKS